MSATQVWLSFNNGAERLRLPVNPESIRLESGYTHNDVSIVQLGDYSIPSGHSFTGITISSFFPKVYDVSYCEYEDIPDPWETVWKIGRWKESKKPIRLTVPGTGINYAMTIRRFDFEERFGSPGDVYFELELKEYVFVHVKKIEAPKTTAAKATVKATPQRPNQKEIPKTYTVQSGDTLSKIAQKLRAQGKKDITVSSLYNANKRVIGKNRDLIKPGQVFTIP